MNNQIEILDKLKENIFFGFTCSIVASYFVSFGYYSYFRFDITSYLTFEDLTMIFSKWIWLPTFIVTIALLAIFLYFEKNNEHSWWDKTILKTKYKRRLLLLIPLLISFVIVLMRYQYVREIMKVVGGISVLLIVILATFSILYSTLNNKKKLSEIPTKGWLNLFFLIYVFIFCIPYTLGALTASKITQDYIIVHFNEKNEVLSTYESKSDLVYIGKTSSYFFIFNTKSKTTTSYNMDLVKSFEFIPNDNDTFYRK